MVSELSQPFWFVGKSFFVGLFLTSNSGVMNNQNTFLKNRSSLTPKWLEKSTPNNPRGHQKLEFWVEPHIGLPRHRSDQVMIYCCFVFAKLSQELYLGRGGTTQYKTCQMILFNYLCKCPWMEHQSARKLLNRPSKVQFWRRGRAGPERGPPKYHRASR